MTLAHSLTSRYIAPVPFNSGTGFGDPSNKADTRHPGGFFTSVHRCTCVQFMAGSSGETFGSAGPLFRFANPAICLPPPFGDGWQASKNKEATMPSIALRAVRVLFPLSAVPVSTVPTHAEACAVARLLVQQGKRIAIAPADRGYTVSEVRA